MSLRIIFFGTADLARPSLAALDQDPAFEVLGVVTQPDRPKGRSLQPQRPPVKVEAEKLGFLVWQPERARDEHFLGVMRDMRPDLLVVVAYGQILSSGLLEIPRFGALNVHASLLPKYRGAAPIQWAILNDEKETGVTIMKMDAGLDTGPIIAQTTTPIDPGDTAQTLHDRLARLGAGLLVESIPGYVQGQLAPIPPPESGSTYARKISKNDGRLQWELPARQLWNRVRALVPWPGAFCQALSGSRPFTLKIWEAELSTQNGRPGEILQADKHGFVVAAGEGALRLVRVQREGGKILSASQFLAGCPLQAGALLHEAV